MNKLYAVKAVRVIETYPGREISCSLVLEVDEMGRVLKVSEVAQG